MSPIGSNPRSFPASNRPLPGSTKQNVQLSSSPTSAAWHWTRADLDEIHDRLRQHLAKYGDHLDAIYVCPHEIGQCHCRKPDIGLFEQAFFDFPGERPGNSAMIGDSLSDIQAGARLGMATIFVPGDFSTQKPGAERARQFATATATSLLDCVRRHLGMDEVEREDS